MQFNSAKELLLHYGKIQAITRGRISAANHKFIAERLSAGDAVGGYEAKVSSKPTGEVVHSNAKAPVSSEKIISDIGYASRDERETQAHVFWGGKKKSVGMRECCANCRASFTYCRCGNSSFRVDFDTIAPVYFEARTTPFKKGW